VRISISTLLVEPVPTLCPTLSGTKYSKRSHFVARVTIRVASHAKDRTALIVAKREAIKLRKAINTLRESHDKDHAKQRLALIEAKREAMITIREHHDKDRKQLIEAHIVAKKVAQKWKLKCEERDKEIQKLTMDNETLAKEVATLKSRVVLSLIFKR
jgi:hypothetical protein